MASSRAARTRAQRHIVSVARGVCGALSDAARAARSTDAVAAQRRRGLNNNLSSVTVAALAAAASGSSRAPTPLAPACTSYDFARLARF